MGESAAAESNGNVPRSTGRVVRFNDKKGYGFIKPDDGDEDLFVHHSAIVSDGGFRTLSVDDIVEFTLSLTDSKYQAVDVTKPGGDHIQPKKSGPGGFGKRGFGGAWNRRNNGGGGGSGCYTCGGAHLARDCNSNIGNNNSNNNNAGVCYKCREAGHFARDCTRGNNNVGGVCYNCGGVGHMARDCVSGGGGDDRSCYNCGGTGHLARNCGDSSRAGAGRRIGGGGGNNGCFNCGSGDHFARDCTKINRLVSLLGRTDDWIIVSLSLR